jgi:hypothetical protein
MRATVPGRPSQTLGHDGAKKAAFDGVLHKLQISVHTLSKAARIRGPPMTGRVRSAHLELEVFRSARDS